MCREVKGTRGGVIVTDCGGSFSISKLRGGGHCRRSSGIFFTYYRLRCRALSKTCTPFLSVVYSVFHGFMGKSFRTFLHRYKACRLRQSLFLKCCRSNVYGERRKILLGRIRCRRQHVARTVITVLGGLARCQPVVVMVGHFRLTKHDSVRLVCQLLARPYARVKVILKMGRVRPQLSVTIGV